MSASAFSERHDASRRRRQTGEKQECREYRSGNELDVNCARVSGVTKVAPSFVVDG
jgi:hypothetical protein